MASCSHCAAPLPLDSPRCNYCGSVNDVDLIAVHTNTINAPASPRICPRCAIALKTIDIAVGQHFYIERCGQCMGMFFDPGELDALLSALVTNVYSIDLKRLSGLLNEGAFREEAITYLKCPVCAALMNRMNFGARSGVVVDTCRDHGVWLDGGELRRLAQWRKAGGELYHEQVEKEKALREEEKQKNSSRNIAACTNHLPARPKTSLSTSTSARLFHFPRCWGNYLLGAYSNLLL